MVFGGTDRLAEQVANTLRVMDGTLYVVLTSCVTEMIGDDVGARSSCPWPNKACPSSGPKPAAFAATPITATNLCWKAC